MFKLDFLKVELSVIKATIIGYNNSHYRLRLEELERY